MDIKIINIINTIVVLLVFASFGWVADSGTINFKFSVYLAMAALGVLLISYRGAVKINYGRVLKLILLIGMFLWAQRVHGRSEELNNIIKLILCIFVTTVISDDEFYGSVCGTAPYILYSAIIGWVCAIFGFGFALPDFLAESVRRVYYVTLSGSVYAGGQEIRAHGIFWEPGVLALYCNLIIILKLFRFNMKIKDCVLEIIVLVLSGSAGGALCFLALIFANSVKFNRIMDRFAFYIIVGVFSIFAYGFFEYYDEFVRIINVFTSSLFDRDLDSDESFNTRSLDLYVPFMAASDSIIFGHKDISRFYSISESIVGYSQLIITNSFGLMVYYYGYVFLIIYVYFMYKGFSGFLFKSERLAFSVMVLCLIVEPVQFSLLMFIIISSERSVKND